MKEINLKIQGQPSNLGEMLIQIDGKTVQCKKNEFGNFTGHYQTQNDKLQLKIFNVLDVGGIFWFLTQIFFFIITIFGIFDVHRQTKCMVIDFDAEIDLQDDNQITLQFNHPNTDGKAVEISTNLICQERANQYQPATRAQRTLKLLKFTKIFLTIAAIVIATLVTVIKL